MSQVMRPRLESKSIIEPPKLRVAAYVAHVLCADLCNVATSASARDEPTIGLGAAWWVDCRGVGSVLFASLDIDGTVISCIGAVFDGDGLRDGRVRLEKFIDVALACARFIVVERWEELDRSEFIASEIEDDIAF